MLKKQEIGIVKKLDTLENRAKCAYLALGSNLGNRNMNINKAKILLINYGIKIIKCSKIYETESWPNKKQQKYDLDITQYRETIERIETEGINTMSLSEITGIPRPTVTRKLKYLTSKGYLNMDKNKLIHVGIGAAKNKDMHEIQNNVFS